VFQRADKRFFVINTNPAEFVELKVFTIDDPVRPRTKACASSHGGVRKQPAQAG